MPYWAQPPYGSCSDATAFQLMSVEPADAGNLATIATFKQQNPGLSLLLSVGGWNFPSAYFSALAASPAARATFIASVQQWMTQYGADGIDVDWEVRVAVLIVYAPYPHPHPLLCILSLRGVIPPLSTFRALRPPLPPLLCSSSPALPCPPPLPHLLPPTPQYPCAPPRTDPVEISCTDFQTVTDTGGSCPADTTNIVTLFSEMRQAMPNKIISLASQASRALEAKMAVGLLAPHVDRFHVMSYDYAVSDIPAAGGLSPNAPLYTPSAPGAVQMSINDTVSAYLSAGVAASKIWVGIPLVRWGGGACTRGVHMSGAGGARVVLTPSRSPSLYLPPLSTGTRGAWVAQWGCWWWWHRHTPS